MEATGANFLDLPHSERTHYPLSHRSVW